MMRTFSKVLVVAMLTSGLTACLRKQPVNFAADAPVRKIVFDLPFPSTLIYQAAPDPGVIIGVAQKEIGGYDVATGNRLWQLPFPAEVVGRTARQIVVFEEQSSSVDFVDP